MVKMVSFKEKENPIIIINENEMIQATQHSSHFIAPIYAEQEAFSKFYTQ